MTQPVTGERAQCFEPCSADPSDPTPHCPAEQAEKAARPHPMADKALTFCLQADTVVEGYLCGEPAVVSNACRKPGNSFDAYVCDEPRMHSLQDKVLRGTVSAIRMLLQILRW